MNESVKEKIEIMTFIYSYSSNFSRSPNCNIFYVTLGSFHIDSNLKSIKEKHKKNLIDRSLFDQVNIRYVDNNEIIKLHQGSQLKIKKEFSIPRNVSFPTVENIQEAYISIITIKEYLDIITENDQIITDLFYDNVRDFQGENPVNKEIKNTIKGERQKYFGFLNNGITLVTKEIKKVGDKLNVNNFQIVNGCQTSTILYNNRDFIQDESYITIKIIGTDDNDVINSIIRATNRQTEVKTEAFESLKEFHKRLEELYIQYNSNEANKIYYERRNKQYAQQSIARNRIITLSAQVNAYVAMFLGQPHSVHRYYGELLKANRIFNDEDELLLYYVSALALFKVDSKIKRLNSNEYKKVKAFKYHIILLIRYLVLGDQRVNPSAKNSQNQSEKIYNILSNDSIFEKYFNDSTTIINKVWDDSFKHKNRMRVARLKEFTEILITESENFSES